MQIVLMASGTRGDVQPMIALGTALRRAGHAVRVIAGSNFAAWIEAHGLEVYPTVDMEALMRSDLGVKWVEGASQREQLGAMKALMHRVRDQTVHDTIQGTQGAELLVSGFVSEPFAQAISEKYGIPQISVALQPYRATRSGAASILPLLPRANSVLNRWMGLLAEQITWSIAQGAVGALRSTLGLPAHTAASYRRAARDIPALYAMSAHVVGSAICTARSCRILAARPKGAHASGWSPCSIASSPSAICAVHASPGNLSCSARAAACRSCSKASASAPRSWASTAWLGSSTMR